MDFIEQVIKIILKTLGPDELRTLVAHDYVWKMFTEKAGLSRNEAEKLREYLKSRANRTMQDRKMFQEEILAMKKLLVVLPEVKAELESCIKKLHALAERVDEVHKGCTMSSVVTSSVSAASGVMRIAGLTLAPFTAGGSLLLSAVGSGLGAAAAVSGAGTTIIEQANIHLAEAEAKRILSISEDKVKRLLGFASETVLKIMKNIEEFKMHMERMVKTIHALRRAVANPDLARDAIRFTTTGGLSAKRAQQVQRAFEGTPLAMTRRARFIEGLSLGLDVYFIVKDAMHLRKGTKAPLAEELRQKAEKLEKALKELVQTLNRCS